MNTHSLTQILKSLTLKKHTKPITILLIAMLALTITSAVSQTQAQLNTSTTPSALHTQGTYILDTNGNTIYLRGMGLAGFAPNLILWGQDAIDGWNNQWNYNSQGVMEQTFKAMRDQWHINYIRVFIYPSWYYRDNIIPAQEDPISYKAQTTPISIKAYLHTLIQTAGKYGLYVDIVPYMLTPSASSFGGDPYASQGYGWQGLPMEDWDKAGQNFLSDAGYSNNELGFWRWFWTDIADTYKGYDNVIFEAWNEPNLGIDNDAIPSGYLLYLQTMYSAIRAKDANNLIMMQWHMGWHPNTWDNNLRWAKQIDSAIPDAFNLVYTTHLYYYAPTDLTQYWKTDYEGLKTQLSDAIKTMGTVAPLVINEEGSCLTKTNNAKNDLTWWTNLLRAQYDLGLGAGAYYWLSDAGLGNIYAGETMLSRGYEPNAMGQAYINNYKPPTPTSISATPTPISATPTSTSTPVPTPTPTPVPTPTPTPTSISATPTPFPSPFSQSTPSIGFPKSTQPIIPPLTPSPFPQLTPFASTPVAQLEDPTQIITWGCFYRHWLSLYWPQYNAWFISRW
ncbi:MAG: glycoside hydrolase family 5 protein [Nitrososphaerota archaeon]|jgi:hypothetical protein|nr:glycoside hydrolase family 5 protein [Nitrososphaerota archaeon]